MANHSAERPNFEHLAQTDAGAFVQALAATYGAAMASWVMSYRLPPDVVEDVMQEAYWLAFAKAAAFEEDADGGAGKWFYYRVLTPLTGHLRKQKRRKEVGLLEGETSFGPSPQDAAHAQEFAEAIEAAEASMTDRQRRVWRYRYYEDRTYAWIGKKLGISTTVANDDFKKKASPIVLAELARRGFLSIPRGATR